MVFNGFNDLDSNSTSWRDWKKQLDDSFIVARVEPGRAIRPTGLRFSVSLIVNDEYRLAISSLDDFSKGEKNPQQENAIFCQ